MSLIVKIYDARARALLITVSLARACGESENPLVCLPRSQVAGILCTNRWSRVICASIKIRVRRFHTVHLLVERLFVGLGQERYEDLRWCLFWGIFKCDGDWWIIITYCFALCRNVYLKRPANMEKLDRRPSILCMHVNIRKYRYICRVWSGIALEPSLLYWWRRFRCKNVCFLFHEIELSMSWYKYFLILQRCTIDVFSILK